MKSKKTNKNKTYKQTHQNVQNQKHILIQQKPNRTKQKHAYLTKTKSKNNRNTHITQKTPKHRKTHKTQKHTQETKRTKKT